MDHPKFLADHQKSEVTSSLAFSPDFIQKTGEVKLDIQASEDKEFLDEIFNSSSSIDEEESHIFGQGRYDTSGNESDEKDDKKDYRRDDSDTHGLKSDREMKDGEKVPDTKLARQEEKKKILDSNDWKEGKDNIAKDSLQGSLKINDQFGNKNERALGDQLWRKSSIGMVDDFGNAFQGRMRNKNSIKSPFGLGEQQLENKTQGLWKQPNSNMGEYGDRNNFNGTSFGNYNARRERLLDMKASPMGNSDRTTRTYAQQRQYTFEEFVHKLYNGKYPGIQTPNINDKELNENYPSEFPDNKRIQNFNIEDKKEHHSNLPESNNDNRGLRIVGEKPNLIPRVLLIKRQRENVTCKKAAVFQKKKPVIENEALHILKDRFISFDTEDSSEDEFFTPNTSMEEAQDDLDDNCEELDPQKEKNMGVSTGSSNAQQDEDMEARMVNFEDGVWDMCMF